MLNAQTCLVLSPATRGVKGTASLDLSLYAVPGQEPSALEWTFEYAFSSVSSLTVQDGPVLASAGKIVLCNVRPGFSKCLVTGANDKKIGNGVVARVIVMLAPEIVKPAIQIKNSLGVTAKGYEIPVSARVLSTPGGESSSACTAPAKPMPGKPGARGTDVR